MASLREFKAPGQNELKEKRALFKGRRIGVLMGGLSGERDISLKSGTAATEALKGLGYETVTIDVTRDVGATLTSEGVQVAFIALHGRYGEDGTIQGTLEMMGLPYTGSGVLASALAMDKVVSKAVFNSASLLTPACEVFKKGTEGKTTLKPPLIVKPASEGSTIGVSLIEDKVDFDKRVQSALDEGFRHDRTVMVEEFIHGREVTVSILDGKVLPVVEITPSEPIYNFKAKYVKGLTEFTVPARLPGGVGEKVEEVSLRAYEALGCRGAARVDLMVDDNNDPYVLEVNTIPGMTGMSLLPLAAGSAGVEYPALVEMMLFCASTDHNI